MQVSEVFECAVNARRGWPGVRLTLLYSAEGHASNQSSEVRDGNFECTRSGPRTTLKRSHRRTSRHTQFRRLTGPADHINYQANNYSKWLSAAGLSALSEHLSDREHLRKSGFPQVVEPEEAVKVIRDFANIVPISHFHSWTLPPGLPPRWDQSHLELFASKVIPAFR